jgi:hypothetical protein
MSRKPWPSQVLARAYVLNGLQYGPKRQSALVNAIGEVYALDREQVLAAGKALCVIEEKRGREIWWTRPNVVAIWWRRRIVDDWGRYHPQQNIGRAARRLAMDSRREVR